MSRVERRSEEGSSRGRETLEFEEDCREYHDDEFKIKLCNFYLHLGKRISDMGYSTSEYRISLHECREKTVQIIILCLYHLLPHTYRILFIQQIVDETCVLRGS